VKTKNHFAKAKWFFIIEGLTVVTMTENIHINLSRDCEALLIPDAIAIMLPKGTEVWLRQELGGSFTVSVNGQWARIAGRDADALGKEAVLPPSKKDALPLSKAELEMQIWEEMQTCFDPEIPVNIVALGLVYDCYLEAMEDGEYHVSITMTLTAPGCGMGPVLANDVKDKVGALPSVKEVKVDIVFEPAWTQDRMSEAAKLELGLY